MNELIIGATAILAIGLDLLPVVISDGRLYTQLCHRDTQCPTMLGFLIHDHISGMAAINAGDATVSTPILEFVRAR
jgi:hypothetical protein